jgi:hypothetical protein
MIPAVVGAAANISEPIIPGDTGWQTAGSAVNHTSGTGNTLWLAASNVTFIGGSDAFTNQLDYDAGGTDTSQYIRAYNFDMSAIPDGAVISRISCRGTIYKSPNNGSTPTGFWLSHDGSVVGDISSNINVTDSETLYTRTEDSGADPLWGAGLTTAQVKSSTFGCFFGGAISCTVYYDSIIAYMNYVQMKVDWVAP